MLFRDIVGQEKAKRFLKRVMSEGRIPHAYLFTGIAGIGKTSMAGALTMALNCREPVDFDGCGACPSCRSFLGGNFPDFILLRPDGQKIKIEQVRELNRRLGFAPVSAEFRVCVIQQAETMTGEAANSFLKALEEPPPHNILILNTREPRDLLPTIVSRCQRVPFHPIPVEEMTRWLIKKKGVEPQRAEVAARGASGSLAGAIRMCEEGFLKMREEWLSGLLGLSGVSDGEAVETAFQWADRNRRGGGAGSGSGEYGLLEMLTVWESWYRDLLVVKAGGDLSLIINVDLADRLNSAAANYRRQALVEILFLLSRAIKDLVRMRNASLVMENTVLRLRRLERAGD